LNLYEQLETRKKRKLHKLEESASPVRQSGSRNTRGDMFKNNKAKKKVSFMDTSNVGNQAARDFCPDD